jgi:hypothetical protein
MAARAHSPESALVITQVVLHDNGRSMSSKLRNGNVSANKYLFKETITVKTWSALV